VSVHQARGRGRWATGLAAVVGLLASGGLVTASASGGPVASSFVAITPCRLFDTRAGSDNVGKRSVPVGVAETFTTPVRGSNGNCTDIPADVTAVSMNVTIVNPTSASFLTVFPSDADKLPVTANLNWKASQAPTPNAVTAALGADGQLSFYNLSGTVDLIVDIVGYYVPTSAGPPGPKGDTGAAGTPAAHPAKVIWVASSGGDFTTVASALSSIIDNGFLSRYVIRVAPGAYNEGNGIDMKDYVDIEGSGLETTFIIASSTATLNATVRVAGAVHAEIRNLSIRNLGGAGPNIGLRFTGATAGSDLRVTHVFVDAIGTSDAYGVYIDTSSAAINDVTVIANGGTNSYGWINNGSSPTMFNVGVTASGASGANTAVWNESSSSPSMNQITATATGGMFALGIDNESSSPTMTDITASASGAIAEATGIANSASSPMMTNIVATATATAGASTFGLVNDTGAAPIVSNLNAVGSGGSFNYGIWNNGGSSTVRNSTMTGSTASIRNDVGTTTVTNSTLNGGGASGAGFTCAQVAKPGPADANATCT